MAPMSPELLGKKGVVVCVYMYLQKKPNVWSL